MFENKKIEFEKMLNLTLFLNQQTFFLFSNFFLKLHSNSYYTKR